MRTLKNVVSLAMFGLVILFAQASDKPPEQAKFATPKEAATALHDAFKTQDMAKMETIFGREGMEACASGDPVADRYAREVIALAMEESWRWAPHGKNAKELIIGNESWPFPIPLVKIGDKWQFDSEAGKEEVLARKIGGNELEVISICRDYVGMQREYASQPHDGKPAGLFAQRLKSSPGLHDGLFWQKKPGEKGSPLGDLVAEAEGVGYEQDKMGSAPFRGYHFRILTAQGAAVPGGQKSYLVNGNLTGGFALLAFPAKYAFSGVMTFVVNQDGVVYQKDLGPDTGTQAPLLTEYNPDESWTPVPEP